MGSRRITRRDLLRLASGALAAPMAGACAGQPAERLAVAPVPPTAPVPSAGPPGALEPLGLGGERDGVLILPPGTAPAPLILMLHGAGGAGRRAARLILGPAEERGCVVLAPDSRGASWDAIAGAFGPDVRFLERSLGEALGRRSVDRTRIAIAGFSDGATYALALGRANGGLFTHVIAFSPGFLLPIRAAGAPRIFVSHGRQDRVLPIDSCSRRMVPRLRDARYEVRYREFDGDHEVPERVAQEALAWFVAPSA